VKPREIAAEVREAAHRCAQGTAAPVDHAVVALRSLVADFTLALERAGNEATRWMSIDQVRILNQLYLAAGK
jgi:hypothetical protein